MGGNADWSGDCKCRRSGAGDFARFGETRWQDMHAMYDLGVSGEKRGPSWQDFYDMYSQTAVCRAFLIHSAQILPKPAHFGYISAICCHRGGVFPSEASFGIHQAKILPRMSAWESFRRIFCHRRHAENASLRYPAAADTRRTHHGEILSPSTCGERIMVKSCHRRNVENGSL